MPPPQGQQGQSFDVDIQIASALETHMRGSKNFLSDIDYEKLSGHHIDRNQCISIYGDWACIMARFIRMMKLSSQCECDVSAERVRFH